MEMIFSVRNVASTKARFHEFYNRIKNEYVKCFNNLISHFTIMALKSFIFISVTFLHRM